MRVFLWLPVFVIRSLPTFYIVVSLRVKHNSGPDRHICDAVCVCAGCGGRTGSVCDGERKRGAVGSPVCVPEAGTVRDGLPVSLRGKLLLDVLLCPLYGGTTSVSFSRPPVSTGSMAG